ncbi:MAG TPA: hypothetical protein VIK12_09740 [Pengzhenrongella sp.]
MAPAEIGATTTSPTSSPTPNPNPGLVVSGARLGRSGQAIVGLNGAVWLTTDAGTTWRALDPTMNPAGGRSVDSRGGTIVALTTEGSTTETTKLVYQWSKDAGKTWGRSNLTPPQSTGFAEIALSADGSSVAVVANTYDSKTSQFTSVIFVGPVGKDLVGRDSPLAGVPAWVGTHLVLAGAGPQTAQLFVSDDRGKTWTETTAAALATASAGTVPGGPPPGIGAPVRSTGGAVVPVTTFVGQVARLSLLTTTDGRTFSSISSVLLGGGGGGETALGSSAGPGDAVFVDFGSPRLFSVRGSTVTKVETTGLPDIPVAITFSDAMHGLAVLNLSECVKRSDGTNECGSSPTLYRTADGGHTWVAATRPTG